ncbi:MULTISPECIES: FAD:protein FMN transferase [Sulfurimonas]|uniref:FAD:protein FMN transferase n=1 Tax=Sulfurimonas TaxID=202746 RepID=UPI00165FD6F6|nr:FAD:protein FMN transferase [Sulfurimonas indica]
MLRLFLVLLLCLVLEADEGLVTRQKVLMGTFVTLSVESAHKELIEPSFRVLNNIEKSLSSFDENSPIYKLNHNKSAKLDSYSYEALQLSLEYYKQTDGYFDIAIGKITKDLYRFGQDERVAVKKELKAASTDMNGFEFNKDEAIITDDIKVDLGGMGKGYGVDKTVAFLKKHKVQKAIVALSGDIRCIGGCKVIVNNPLREDIPLASFTINNSGVSTSGNYNRYVKEKKYNHLINPKTKESASNFLSVTLISKLPSATLDAYATAVSVMPKNKAYMFLDLQPLAYIILESDKSLHISHDINDYVDDLKRK